MATFFEAVSEARDILRKSIPVPALYVEYPFPRLIELFPVLILTPGDGDLLGSDEQVWEENVRGILLTGLVDSPINMTSADQLIEPIADTFAASIEPSQRARYSLNGKVDFFRVDRYELGAVVEIGQKNYYGGNIWFQMKRRRFAE